MVEIRERADIAGRRLGATATSHASDKPLVHGLAGFSVHQDPSSARNEPAKRAVLPATGAADGVPGFRASRMDSLRIRDGRQGHKRGEGNGKHKYKLGYG
jgi:hypothetical protein